MNDVHDQDHIVRTVGVAAREPEPGDYWRNLETGVLVVVTEIRPKVVCFHDTERDLEAPEDRHYDQTWQLARRAFGEQYVYVPSGAHEREAEIVGLGAGMRAAHAEARQLGSTLAALSGGGAAEAEAEAPGTALALTTEGGVQQAEAQKRQVATLRNDVGKFAIRMKKDERRLKALMREQRVALEARMRAMTGDLAAQMAGLSKMLKIAEETIWTINLYLGKAETIRLLRDGEPAHEGTKIALRQMVLYMDEESALNSDDGGIDFQSLDQFDAWVLESPDHLNQLLPNTKGVVAIRARRNAKTYSENAMVNAELNKLNQHTYFLIRNGEKVYRIDTDLEVGETLLPRLTEFAEIFERTVYENVDGERVKKRVMLQPGTEEYMKAMDSSKGRERHYLRVFLFLQGLLDRTTVFQPLGVTRLNVFDMLRQDDHLEFVLDAETGRQLGDGRPEFAEWIASINARTDVGCRLIGRFVTREYGEGRREGTSRVHPAFASSPDSETLYTVDRVEKDRYGQNVYTFLYERTDDVQKRNRWGGSAGYDKATRRASCRVKDGDKEFLNFDAATEADIIYYLKSRRNRHLYERMFPVLTRALAYKERELAEERPFRTALSGALMREHGIGLPEAESAVAELVDWWKFKNRTHRALLSDDEKASRMILAEYVLRQNLSAERARAEALFDGVVNHLRTQNVDFLAVYHVRGPDYIVYEAMESGTVYLRETKWKFPLRGAPAAGAVAEWVIADTRRMHRWHLVRSDSRWAAWSMDAKEDEHLTGPERAALMAHARSHMSERYGTGVKRSTYDERGAGVPVYIELARYDKGEKGPVVYVQTNKARMPRTRLLTGGWHEPVVRRVTLEWTKKNGFVKSRVEDHTAQMTQTPFVEKGERDTFWSQPECKKVPAWSDEAAIQALKVEWATYSEAYSVVPALEAACTAYVAQATQAVKDRLMADVRAAFDADYGDEELWEGHLKQVKFPHVCLGKLEHAIPYLVERDMAVVGLSAQEVMDAATALGWDGTGGERFRGDSDVLTEAEPGFRFAPIPAPEEEDEGEEMDDDEDGEDDLEDEDEE